MDRKSKIRNQALVIFLLLILIGCTTPKVCIEDECYKVEIVTTPKEKTQGLMHKENLEDGMLFLFPIEAVYTFWMKDTLIPLDIIWINNNEIVYVAKDTTPYSETSINPNVNAKYVLEINAGSNHKVGDKVTIYT